jgi:hypothetical protein
MGSLIEVQTQWSMTDIAHAHELLDVQEEMEEFYSPEIPGKT